MNPSNRIAIVGLATMLTLASESGIAARVAPVRERCETAPLVKYNISMTSIRTHPTRAGEPSTSTSVVSLSTVRTIDLDGNGEADFLVPEPATNDCSQDYHFAIYLSQGTCARRVGVVNGNLSYPIPASAPRTHGLPELTTRTSRPGQFSGHDGELRVESHTYQFDGTSYREIRSTRTDTSCSHCSRLHCVSERVPYTP